MGNEIGSFKDCSLETSYDTTSSTFAVYGGNAKDGTDVSVFVYTEEEVGSDMIKNSVKYLKTLKHPGIVKLLGVDKCQEETWLITERVKPLESVIDTLTEEDICAGLYDIIQVMVFIHEKAGLCHNSLSISSVFVAEGGAWKIAGLECMCPFDKATPSELSRLSKFRPQACIAPEEKKGYKMTLELGHARDTYAFGHLAEQLLELMSYKGDKSKTFELRLQDECLSDSPHQRPQMSSFLHDQLFKSDFVSILNFLRTLTIQSESRKDHFFRDLAAKLFQLPPNLVASRLARPLLARFVLLEKSAVDYLIPHLLTPCQGAERSCAYCEGEVNPLLPAPLFKQYVVPELVKILHVRDAHIRMVLLRHFRHYCQLFEPSILKAVVLPQVLLGLRDVNDELGELSLRALADLVPLLGGASVISAHRRRLFTSGTPNFKKSIAPSITANGGPKSSPLKTAHTKLAEVSRKDVAKEEERERRREEARRRTEERRARRAQRKKQPQKDELIENDTQVAKTIESDDGGPIDINKTKPESTGIDVNKEIVQSEETCRNSNSDDLDPDKLNDSFDRTESDIDLEIEQELYSMESTLPKEKQQKIQALSESHDSKIEASSETIKVDWSDISTNSHTVPVSENVSKKGVLKLKSPMKSKLSPPPSKSTSVDCGGLESVSNASHESASFRHRRHSNEMDDWENSWDDINPDFNQSPSPPSPQTPKSPPSAAMTGIKSSNKPAKKFARKTGPPKIQDNLGADYDIKSLDVKTFKGVGGAMQEVDFFADMAPSLQPKSANVLNMLSANEKTAKKAEKSSSASALSFAVQGAGDTDAAGGWENEDFEW